MSLLAGLGKWLKDEFDNLSGVTSTPPPAPQTPAPRPTPQPAQPQWHAPLALPPSPAQPSASQPQVAASAYPNVSPDIRNTIQNSVHLNPAQKANVLQGLNQKTPQFNPLRATAEVLGGQAVNLAKGAVQMPVDTALQIGKQFRYLTSPTATDAQRQAILQGQQAAQHANLPAPTKSLIAQAPAASKTEAFKAIGTHAPLGQINQNLTKQVAGYNALTQKGIGNAAQAALIGATPSVDALATNALNRFVTNPALLRVGAGTLTGAVTGGPFNVAAAASSGNVKPQDIPQIFAQGTLGGAVIGGTGGIVHAAPLLADSAKTGATKLGDLMSAPAAHAAEQASGIPKENVINDNEAGTLRDFADYKTGDYRPDTPTLNNLLKQARNAAETAGIDVNSGSPVDVTNRIYDYLSKRRQFISAHDAMMQGGYARVPFLEGNESEIDPISQEYAAEKTPQEIVKEHADMLRSLDTGTQGGVITAQGTRVSEHTPFYREYFAEHGRAPSKAAYVEQATKELETGKGDMLDPGMAEAYHLAKQRDSDNAALIQHPSQELAQDSYYYGPDLNKGAFTRIDRTKLMGKALDTPNRELTTASGKYTETPERSIRISRTRPDQVAPSSVEPSLLEGISPAERADKLRELGLPSDQGSYSEHTPKTSNGANLTQDEINRLVNEDVATYNQNQFPKAGGSNMKALSDRQMREVVLEAKRRSDAESANVVQRHTILDNAIRNGVAKGEDRLFFEAVEHPEKVSDILQNVKNPDKFMQAVSEMRNFNDFAAKRSAETGTPINYRQNYLRHNVDLSDPEQLARYLELAKARGRLSKPGYAKERIFDDLNDLERNGFKLKYNDARDLAKDYANSVSSTTSRNALVNHLKQNAPGHITTVDTEGGMIPTDMNGREFVTGRSNGLQRTFMSPQLSDNVAKYVEPIKIGRVAKSIDTANQALKQSTLALGGFHDLNVTKRYVTQEIASGLTGEPRRLLNSVVNSAKQDAAFWSKNYYTHELAKFRESGLLDRATHDGNLTLNKTLDTGSLEKQINGKPSEIAISRARQVALMPHNVNEFIHEFLFGRKIPLMKLQTLQSEMERYNIPLKGDLTPEQQTKLVALTDQINNMYGGINKGLIAQTGAGKYIQRQLMLAPDFTGGNINSVAGMVHGGAKSLAWRQNMGNYLSSFVMASVATGLVAAATGHNGAQVAEDKLKKMLTPNSGTFLTPSIDLPYTDSKGNHLVVSLPGSPVEEAAKLHDPAHFLISRGASLPRLGTELATNQNYYGQPLVDPYQNPNPTVLDNAQAVAGSVTPIPIANGIQLATGKQNLATTALNTAGLRVSKDQSDPNVQQAQQYFNEYNQLVNALNPNERAALQVIQPTQKDRNGNYVVAPTVFDTPDKAETLLRFPNVLNGMTALNRNLAAKGQSVDPFYTELSPEQQRAALVRETINKNNTQQLTAWDQQNPWYKQFQQDRSVFYNSLPPTDPNKPKNPIQPPVETPDVQALYNQVDQISDPKTKAQFYASHPELTDYQQQMAEYTNKVLVASGLTPLKLPPVADKDTQSYMSTYMAANPQQRQAMKQGNPEGYNKMEAYMQNVSEYEVAKNGALDQLQGQTPNQSLLKGINSLATYDMLRNPDGTLALKYGSVNPGATSYGSVAATPQQSATQAGVGGHSSHKKSHRIYMKPAKRIRVYHEHKQKKVFLETPVSPVRIRNRANKHVGIHRTTYL